MAGVPVLTESKAIATYGPSHVELAVAALRPKASNGTGTFVEQVLSFRSHYRNLAAVGDYDEYDVALSAGSWTLTLEGWQGASLGRVAVLIDGVQAGIIDQYDPGSTVAARQTLPGLSIRTGGLHTVRFIATTKNASSGGTAVRLSHASFTREGPCAVPTRSPGPTSPRRSRRARSGSTATATATAAPATGCCAAPTTAARPSPTARTSAP
jgi:hypothetical protein